MRPVAGPRRGALDSRRPAQRRFSRGSAYQLKGPVDRAMADYTQAIRVDPKNVDAYSSRGALYLTTSRFPQALVDLRRALALDPSDEHVKKSLRELGVTR